MDIYSVIGIALAPLAAALLFGVIGGGIRLAIARYMPDCWLKRQLLAERIKTQYSRANRRIAEEAAAHPHHHCPFCILKPEYDYQGYWLYLPLFAAAAAGMSAGVLRIFSRWPSLEIVVPKLTGRLAGIAAIGYGLFALIASIMIWRSNLILF